MWKPLIVLRKNTYLRYKFFKTMLKVAMGIRIPGVLVLEKIDEVTKELRQAEVNNSERGKIKAKAKLEILEWLKGLE